MQFVFYGQEINSIINNISFTGGIIDVLTYLWAFISIFTSLLLVSLPQFPTVLQIVILVPFWGALIYIMMPVLERIATLIVAGIDAIIPF